MKLTSFTVFLTMALIVGCGSGAPEGVAGDPEGPGLDFSDPGEETLRRELLTLPFKREAWMYRFTQDKIVRATLGIEHLYLETADNTVICVDRHQGFTIWRYHLETDRMLDWPPVESAGVPEEIRDLEAALLHNLKEIDEAVLEEGRPNEKSMKLQKRRRELREQLRVAQYSDNVYLLSKGLLTCIDRRSGSRRWSYQVNFIPGGRPFAVRNYCFIPGLDLSRVWQLSAEREGREIAWFRSRISGRGDNHITTQPVFSDPSLFFVSHDGKVYAFDVSTGQERWVYSTDGPLKADPVVFTFMDDLKGSDGKVRQQNYRLLFVGGTDGTFYAVDGDGGVLHWKYECGAPIYEAPHARGETVYVKTRNGALHAFDVNPQHLDSRGSQTGPIRSGVLRWKLPLGERFLVKGRVFVYVMGPDHTIYAMDEMTGKVMGRYPLSLFPMVLSNTVDDMVYFIHASGYVFAMSEPNRKN